MFILTIYPMGVYNAGMIYSLKMEEETVSEIENGIRK